MTLQLNQIRLVTAIIAEVTRQAKEQGARPPEVIPFQMNAIVAAANGVVAAYAREPVMAKPDMGLGTWLACDDTGSSSLCMAGHIWGAGERTVNHPLDPDDFGRCHRFIEAVPGTREQLDKMKDVSPTWSRLVDNWENLIRLYLAELPTGSCPKLYARMKELGC